MNRRPSHLPLIAVCLSILVPVGLAQEIAYEKYRLDNGLVVILHEDHTLPRVAVNVWYRVGSRDEEPGRSGFAHLFEHLMFMGTRRVPGSQFDEIMEAGGGSNNASTGNDRTNYFSSGPSNLLATLLWLEADRLEDLGSAMTQEKLDLQREVVRNEIRENYENEPYGKAGLWIPRLMYPEGHPYHTPVVGSHEDLEAATVDDVKEFFARHYVANGASLVVAGDFDSRDAKRWIEEYFGDLEPAGLPARRIAGPVTLERPIVFSLEDDVPFAKITLAYHSPAAYAEGDAEMALAAEVLAGSKTSRLFRRLVSEEKLASEVVAWQEAESLGSLFQLEVTANEGADLARILEIVDEEILVLAKAGPKADELERRVSGYEKAVLRGLQDIDRKADLLNSYEYYLGEPDSIVRDLDRYRKATPESVRAWSAKVLVPEARLTLTTLPARERLATSPREARPDFGASTPFTPPAPETIRLTNGVEVFLWERKGTGLVAVTSLFAGGSALDPEGKEGLANLAGQMIEEGTRSRTSVDYAEELERLGASFGVSGGTRATSATLSVLARNAEKALALYAEALRTPRFDPADWDRIVRLQSASIREDLEDPGAIARIVADRHFYGAAHPYGRPSSGTLESVARLTIEDASRFAASVVRPDRMRVVVAGDMSRARAMALLDPVLGAWTAENGGGEGPAIRIEPPHERPLAVYVVHRERAVQTVIRLVHAAPPRTSPDRLGLVLVDTILGGTFTSRLNANLREDKGYTYGAGSSLIQTPDLGAFTISTAVRADVTEESLAEIARELERLRANSITPEELDKGRRSTATAIVERYSTLDSILRSAATLLVNDADLAEPGRDLAALAQVDVGTANALAGRHFDPKSGILVLVGDRERILPALARLGLPTPVLCDATGAPIASGGE